MLHGTCAPRHWRGSRKSCCTCRGAKRTAAVGFHVLQELLGSSLASGSAPRARQTSCCSLNVLRAACSAAGRLAGRTRPPAPRCLAGLFSAPPCLCPALPEAAACSLLPLRLLQLGDARSILGGEAERLTGSSARQRKAPVLSCQPRRAGRGSALLRPREPCSLHDADSFLCTILHCGANAICLLFLVTVQRPVSRGNSKAHARQRCSISFIRKCTQAHFHVRA